MRQHTYHTPSGTEVTIQIVTETENLADHNFTNPCYELEVRLNGQLQHPQGIEQHESYPHGLLYCGTIRREGRNQRLLVPMDETAREIWDEYQAEVSRRLDQRLAADREYEEGRARIERAMDQ
jgi:hypothetical protein